MRERLETRSERQLSHHPTLLSFPLPHPLSRQQNYQIWHHRRAVVELLGDGSKEKEWTGAVFENDAKNYHAWSHRQWAVQHFKLWDGELEYCDRLIREDVRNNSAWNQRWFVLSGTGDLEEPAALARECNLTLERLKSDPDNGAATAFLLALLRRGASGPAGDGGEGGGAAGTAAKAAATGAAAGSATKVGMLEKTIDGCDALLEEHGKRAVGTAAALVDLLELRGTTEDCARAVELCTRLAGEMDPVRRRFWEQRRGEVSRAAES